MRRISHSFLRGIVTVALASLAAASSTGDKLDAVRDVLKRPWADDNRTQPEVVRGLSMAGVDVATLFQLYSGELDLGVKRTSSNQTDWWCEPERFNQLYLEALGAAPANKVLKYLRTRATSESSLDLKLQILRVLEALESPESADLLIDLSVGIDPLHLRSGHVESLVQRSFSVAFRAGSTSIRAVEKRVGELSDPLRTIVGSAATQSPCPQSVALLEKLIDANDQIALRNLVAIGEMHKECPWLFEDEANKVIRPYLFSKNWQLRKSAVVALAKTRDFDSFAAIVFLLDDEQEAVRRSTGWALRELSGSSQVRTPTEWLDWFDTESEWWTDNREKLANDIRSSNAKEVIGAVRSLTNRPCFAIALHSCSPSLSTIRKRTSSLPPAAL